MTDLVIRRATLADVPALGRLGAELMRVHHAFDADRFMGPGADPETGYARFLGAEIDDPASVIFVADHGAQALFTRLGFRKTMVEMTLEL